MSRQDLDSRFQDLYHRYYRSIFAYLVRCGFSRDRAEEIAQEAFLRVYRSMDRYRGDAEWSFLQTTARNLAFNEIRALKTLKRTGVEVSLEEHPHLQDLLARNPRMGQAPVSPEVDLVERQEAARRRKQLRDAVAELPEGIQKCLLLRLGGLKYSEIQERLHISMDAVKARLHEARGRLRARLAEEPGGIDWPAAPGEYDHDQED